MGELMEKCGLSLYGVRYHLRKLRNQKTIVRIGGTNGGYWKVSNVKQDGIGDAYRTQMRQ